MSVRPHTDATVCRRCPVRCDTVVYLAGCVAVDCPSLYAHERDGRRHVGCLQGIFAVEIDLEAFRRLQAARPGFGALRAVRPPLPVCRTEIDSAFEHRAVGACLNPEFLLSGSGPIEVTVGGRADDGDDEGDDRP